MGVPRKLLGAGEQVVISRRPHAKIMFWPGVALVLVSLGVGVGAALIPRDARPLGQVAIAALGLLLVAWWCAAPFVRWLSTTYTVTTRRLIIRSGVLRTVGQDLPLTRISGVSYERSLGDRMLGCGTLVIRTGAEVGPMVLQDVPDVEHAHAVLTELLFGPAYRDDVSRRAPRGATR
ncbi:MAG: PH domain-containing protein [Actinomycetes bacterium]